MKNLWGGMGLPLSIALHLAIFAIPLSFVFDVPARLDGTGVTLFIEKAAARIPNPLRDELSARIPEANKKPEAKPQARAKSQEHERRHPGPDAGGEPQGRPAPSGQEQSKAPAAGGAFVSAESGAGGGIGVPAGHGDGGGMPSGSGGGGGSPGAGAGRGVGGDTAGGGGTPQVDKEKLLAEYKRRVYGIIQNAKNYPAAARRRGIQGAAGVAFTIRADGAAADARVIRTSGFAALDDAAVETIVKIGRFPPLPRELALERLELGVSIVFKLE